MITSCPSCGSHVPPDARFCARCGHELASGCPSCGAPLAEDARFCSSCGHKVGTDEATSTERKVISALFADLVDFTSTADLADPEDIGAMLSTYHDMVRAEVERYGGRIEKLIGDGVFAVFGAPTTHEDDPERSVRAAIRVQEAVSKYNESTAGNNVTGRVAVTTGEAIVRLDGSGDHEGVVGDVVNTASRLQQIAPAGGVIVDERTYLGTRNVITYESLPAVSLKGKSDPVPIWQAVSARTSFGVGVDIDAGTPFVGRQREIQLMTDTFERAVEESSVQLITISGEPGVGKSRLIAEFLRVIDDRPDLVLWRQGRCLPYGDGVSYWAFGEIVKAQAGILESESDDETAAKLSAAVADVIADESDRDWVRRCLAPLVGSATATADRGELFAGWLAFINAMAAQNPLVMVIEDLHWADDALVEFLDYVTERAVDAPMLVLCNTRPDFFSSHPAWGGGKRNAYSIAISPLNAEETTQLVKSLGEVDQRSLDTLIERSGGNPLYATEFVRMLGDQGRSGLGDEQMMPDTIQALIAARLDLLSPEEKMALQAAAVVGRVFWPGAISFVTQIDPGEVNELLSHLARRELIRPSRRSSMKGQAEFGFWHALVQDVAYSQLPRGPRQRTHSAVAQWIEANSGTRTSENAELLAHHYGEALKLAKIDGAPDRLLVEQTRRFLLMAGSRLVNIDPAKAVTFLSRGLGLDPQPPQRITALTELGRSECELKDNVNGIRHLHEAVDLAEEIDDKSRQIEALDYLCFHTWYMGDAEATDALDRLAEGLIEGMEPGPAVSRVVAGRASRLSIRGDDAAALEAAETALSMAREWGPPAALVRALNTRGSARVSLGDREGLADMFEALSLAHQSGETHLSSVVYNGLGTQLLPLEGPERSIELMDEALTMCRERGLFGNVGWSTMTLIESLYQSTSWDRLRDEVEWMLSEYGDDGTQVSIGASSWNSVIAYDSGDFETAVHHGQRWLDGSYEIQDAQFLAPATAFMCAIETERRNPEKAYALAIEFEKVTASVLQIRAAWLDWVAGPMIEADEQLWLETLIAPISSAHPLAEHSIQLVLGRIAAARNDHTTAAELTIAAADGLHGIHALTEAKARIEAGRSLRESGRMTGAADQLALARSIANGLKANRLLEEIDALS